MQDKGEDADAIALTDDKNKDALTLGNVPAGHKWVPAGTHVEESAHERPSGDDGREEGRGDGDDVNGQDGIVVQLQRSDANAKTVDQVIDSIGFGRYQVWLLCLCGAGWAADILDLQVVAYLIPVLAKD